MKKLMNYCLCFGLALTMCACGSSTSTNDSTSANTTPEETTNTEVVEVKEPSEEFLELIAPFGLEDVDTTFLTRDNVAVYGHEVDDLTLEIMGFTADDDIVQEMENIMYYDISDFTDEQIDNLETNIESLVEDFENLDNCIVDYGKQDDSIYVLSLIYTDMDDKENLQAVIDAGGLSLADDATDVTYLGFTSSCDSLADNGWIAR